MSVGIGTHSGLFEYSLPRWAQTSMNGGSFSGRSRVGLRRYRMEK